MSVPRFPTTVTKIHVTNQESNLGSPVCKASALTTAQWKMVCFIMPHYGIYSFTCYYWRTCCTTDSCCGVGRTSVVVLIITGLIRTIRDGVGVGEHCRDLLVMWRMNHFRRNLLVRRIVRNRVRLGIVRVRNFRFRSFRLASVGGVVFRFRCFAHGVGEGDGLQFVRVAGGLLGVILVRFTIVGEELCFGCVRESRVRVRLGLRCATVRLLVEGFNLDVACEIRLCFCKFKILIKNYLLTERSEGLYFN